MPKVGAESISIKEDESYFNLPRPPEQPPCQVQKHIDDVTVLQGRLVDILANDGNTLLAKLQMDLDEWAAVYDNLCSSNFGDKTDGADRWLHHHCCPHRLGTRLRCWARPSSEEQVNVDGSNWPRISLVLWQCLSLPRFR